MEIMRYLVLSILTLIFFTSIACFKSAEKPSGKKSIRSIYDYSFKSIEGKDVGLNSFKGKKILFVNVASECGFTPQYTDLEKSKPEVQG